MPTTAKRGTSVYTAIEPVAAVSVADSAGVARALRDAIARKNVAIPPIKGRRPPPVLLKYAGVQTWSAFARDASTWNIEENEGAFQIVGHRMHPKGYWVEDAAQRIKCPPGTKIDSVIDRMITILQETAKRPQ